MWHCTGTLLSVKSSFDGGNAAAVFQVAPIDLNRHPNVRHLSKDETFTLESLDRFSSWDGGSVSRHYLPGESPDQNQKRPMKQRPRTCADFPRP